MKTYPIPMVPGPVSVPEEVRAVYRTDYGSADLESEFFELYAETEKNLRKIMGTENSVVIQTGEAMLVLWGALKSCLRPGDRVFGRGHGGIRAGHRRNGGRRRRRGQGGRFGRQPDHFRLDRNRKGGGRIQTENNHRRPLRNAFRHAQSAGRPGQAQGGP